MSSKTNPRCPGTSDNDLFTINSNIINHKSTSTATTHGNFCFSFTGAKKDFLYSVSSLVVPKMEEEFSGTGEVKNSK